MSDVPPVAITFAEAGKKMLADMEASSKRDGSPKWNTFLKAKYCFHTVSRVFGKMPLSAITGQAVFEYIQKRKDAKRSGSTINSEYQVIRKVVESVLDHNRNCVYRIQWKSSNLALPSRKATGKDAEKRRPKATVPQIEYAIGLNLEPYSQLAAFLAFTGMRLGEAVACRIGADDPNVTHWDADTATVHVRTAIDVGDEHAAKTKNSAMRIVDLSQEANGFLSAFIRDRIGFLFTESREPLKRGRLYQAAKTLQLPGGFHCLRRARITWLYKIAKTPAHEQLIKFWVGHESHEATQTAEYSKLWQDDAYRKEFAEKAGIGFSLPKIAAPVTEQARELVTA